MRRNDPIFTAIRREHAADDALIVNRTDLSSAMKRADIALYRAKSAGRARVHLDASSI